MTRPAAILMALVVGLLSLGLRSGDVHADATIETTTIRNEYPKLIAFDLKANAPVEITDVTLAYRVLGRNTSALGKPKEFTSGTNITTTVEIETNPNTNWIPAGNDFEWHWELKLADGTTTTGPTEVFTYLPPGKEWKTAKSELATVYYFGPRENLAGNIVKAIDETYKRIGTDLLKTDIPRKPVKVLLLGENKDLQEASPSKGTTLDNSDQVVTCGFRPGNANDIIFGAITCGGSDPVDTMRHEFGHILNAAAGEGTLVNLPVWMDEGLAVYAQESADEYEATFTAAARAGRLIAFKDMNSQASDENRIILQYGQSHAMVKYLIDEYGPEKLRDMLALTKSNTRFDQALQRTYGFDINGFEDEFITLMGSGAPATVAPTTRPQQQQQPTTAPTTRPAQTGATQAPSTSNQAGADDDNSVDPVALGIIGGAVIFALLAIFCFLLAQVFSSNRRPPAAPPGV